nr:MAG TPA: hypothetical protein [Caudoviricetes sp.]
MLFGMVKRDPADATVGGYEKTGRSFHPSFFMPILLLISVQRKSDSDC